MANTFSQIYIQTIFAVNGRQSLIPKIHKEELHKYITGIVQNRGAKMLAVNCMPDHTHIFYGMKPSLLISDLVRDIKTGSCEFINNKNWIKGKFNWEEGYGAFSYSRSHMDRVIKYILNQEWHHKRKTFKEEYLDFLKKFDIPYEEKYLFKWIE